MKEDQENGWKAVHIEGKIGGIYLARQMLSNELRRAEIYSCRHDGQLMAPFRAATFCEVFPGIMTHYSPVVYHPGPQICGFPNRAPNINSLAQNQKPYFSMNRFLPALKPIISTRKCPYIEASSSNVSSFDRLPHEVISMIV